MTHEEMIMGIHSPGASKIYTPAGGLLLEPDIAPFTSECMYLDYAGLFDTDYETLVSEWWTSLYAFGLDLGSAKEVVQLVVRLRESHGTAGGWWPGYEGNQMDIYKAADLCNWTLVQQYDSPPLSSVVGAFCKAVLTLSIPTTARYWKIVNSDPNELTAESGYSYGITEIEAVHA